MTSIAALVLGIGGLLALIAVLPLAATRLRLPYSVLLAVVGSLLGAAIGVAEGLSTHGIDAPLIAFLQLLGTIPITAEIFLWIFLPLLLFETALNLDGRDLLDDLAAILVLAVVAVVLCTVIAGFSLYYTTTFGIITCLLVASIIATTDPAAVISIFREVGAPRRLASLVEGESLLNDAAAIALFSALLATLLGPDDTPNVWAMIEAFLREFLGGAVLGLIFGRIAATLVSRVDQGGPAEVTASLALAYLTYAIADFNFHVSGVVAVVMAGLVFGTVGRTRIGAKEWHTVTTIWSQLGFWSSSLIFILGSMLVPRTLASATWSDMLALGVLLVAAIVARLMALFGILPVVNRLAGATFVDNRTKLVIVWGGLRGAVTLALALAVSENRAVPEDIRHFVSVLATGFVLFTLLVQATTLRGLISWLRLDELSPVEKMLRLRALDLARVEVKDRLSAAAINNGLDPDVLKGIEPVLIPSADLEELKIEPGEDLRRQQNITALATVTGREMQLYIEEMARRMVSRVSGRQALRNASLLFDQVKARGFAGYRNGVKRIDRFDRGTRFAAFLQRRFGIQGPLARRLSIRVEMFLIKRRIIEELLGFTNGRIKALFGERTAELIDKVLEARFEQIDRNLDALRLQYPRHWDAALKQYLGRIATRLEYDRYQRMYEEGLLSPQLLHSLISSLRERRRRLERVPKLDLGLDVVALMRDVPLFAGLPDERLRDLRRLLRPRLALPDEIIMRQGEYGDTMVFVASGALEVGVGDSPVRLGTGDFVGELSLIQRRPRVATVRALGYCQLLELNRDAFRTFLKRHPDLMREVRKTAEARLRGRQDNGDGSSAEGELAATDLDDEADKESVAPAE
ncbi:cation:proton antiporter [Arboricoccus pini]|nr:cation:proton antiporter [Arboricoccus pini]